MWIAKKTAGKAEDAPPVCIGTVTKGGSRPAVMTEGESRNAELAACPGVYVPAVGDEVVLGCTGDGETVVLGRLSSADGVGSGEVCISVPGGGSIVLRRNGSIELSGSIRLTGQTFVEGPLVINGQPYVPALPLG